MGPGIQHEGAQELPGGSWSPHLYTQRLGAEGDRWKLTSSPGPPYHRDHQHQTDPGNKNNTLVECLPLLDMKYCFMNLFDPHNSHLRQ